MTHESPVDMPTIGKVKPAVEGEVTMQQLLDAMAHMAHDIDVLRAQVAAMVDRAEASVAVAESAAERATEIAQSSIAAVQSDPTEVVAKA